MKTIAQITPEGIFCSVRQTPELYGKERCFVGYIMGKPKEIKAIGDRWFIAMTNNGNYIGSLWADIIQRGE